MRVFGRFFAQKPPRTVRRLGEKGAGERVCGVENLTTENSKFCFWTFLRLPTNALKRKTNKKLHLKGEIESERKPF